MTPSKFLFSLVMLACVVTRTYGRPAEGSVDDSSEEGEVKAEAGDSKSFVKWGNADFDSMGFGKKKTDDAATRSGGQDDVTKTVAIAGDSMAKAQSMDMSKMNMANMNNMANKNNMANVNSFANLNNMGNMNNLNNMANMNNMNNLANQNNMNNLANQNSMNNLAKMAEYKAKK